MNPVLYEQTETEFTTQGIGVLAEALKCVVTEELNNVYDLEMEYPVTGAHFSDLTLRRIVKAKPNQTDDPQPFRIYRITKPLAGIVTVYAHHLSYDLSGMVVPPFTVNTPGGVIASITATALPTIQPFSFTNTVTGSADFRNEKPQSARAVLSGFLNVYGGELSYDVTDIGIAPQRGEDKNAIISYGKNLMDIKQEENCADICTAIYPYYHTDEATVTLTGKIINLPGTFDFNRILPVDLTSAFPELPPTENELRAAANQYIADNNLGVPQVHLDISYLSIEDSEEAISLHMYEGIALGDWVSVEFEKMGISAKSRCVKYVYDAVEERVESITIGEKPVTFADTVAKQYQAVKSGEYESEIMGAIAQATQLITNGLGGYVIIHRSNPALENPDELLILGDSPDLNEAQQVWRWNKDGLGYSSTGYGGTYSTAITSDGKIVANMITTGILTAIEISNGNGFHVTANGQMTATNGTIGGFTIDGDRIYNNVIQMDNTYGFRVFNDGRAIGRIGVLNDTDLSVILSGGGQTLSINVENSDGTYDSVLVYDKANQIINIYKDVYCQSHTVYGVTGIAQFSDASYTAMSFNYSEVSITAGQPGYITITNKTALFNAYGQYLQSVTNSTNTYQTNSITEAYS